jgi:hypothetical protein
MLLIFCREPGGSGRAASGMSSDEKNQVVLCLVSPVLPLSCHSFASIFNPTLLIAAADRCSSSYATTSLITTK